MIPIIHVLSTWGEDKLKVLVQSKGRACIDIPCIFVFVYLTFFRNSIQRERKNKTENKYHQNVMAN